jgi:hypothetical protein
MVVGQQRDSPTELHFGIGSEERRKIPANNVCLGWIVTDQRRNNARGVAVVPDTCWRRSSNHDCDLFPFPRRSLGKVRGIIDEDDVRSGKIQAANYRRNPDPSMIGHQFLQRAR